MNIFINLRDGLINATSYRPCNCQVTTLDDLMTAALAGSDEYLTASFDREEFLQHPEAAAFALTFLDGNPNGLEEIWDNLDIA